MKKLLTLFILLLPFTAFAQNVDQARWHLEQALELLSEQSASPEITDVTYEGNNLFTVHYNPFQADSMDIKFMGEGLHDGYLKVDDYWQSHKDSPNPNSGVHPIRIRQSDEVEGRVWRFQIITENHASDVFETEIQPRAPTERLDVFTAFWGSNDVPDNDLKRLMSAGIHKSPNERPIRQIIDYGHKAVAYIGLTPSEDQTEHEIRSKVRVRHSKFQQIGYEHFEFIILDDEPYRRGYTAQQLEWMVDEAQSLYEVPVTFMSMEYHLAIQELPKNLKLVGVNLYPLKKRVEDGTGHTQAWVYEEFKTITDDAFGNAYRQLEDPEFVITVQLFGTRDGSSGPQWRMPTKEELEWYFRYAQENRDVVGLVFWKWNSEPNSKYEGLSTRPELQEALEELLIKYTL